MAKSGSGEAGSGRGARLTDGQRAYETRRAKEAGLSLDAWLARKARSAAPAVRADAARPTGGKKGKGLLARLLDRAHRPI